MFWPAFTAGHLWLALVGIGLRPESTYDVGLYRFWIQSGLRDEVWPVLDTAWVYPVGALAPLLAAAPAAATELGYLIAWFALVTALDAAAAVVLRRRPAGHVGAWWWLAATVLLGPVALGRLDGVVVPLMVVALVWAARRPGLATALLTAAAWVKVAPGAGVLALLATTRHPWQTVVLPGAAVTGVVAGAALSLGAGWRVLSFLGTQGDRGLQIEAVAATPFSLARLTDARVWATLNTDLNTFEVAGVDTSGITVALDVLLALGAAGVSVLAWSAVRRGAERTEALLVATFALALTLVVANKVGSPQFMTWLLPPVAVTLSGGGQHGGWGGPWRAPAVLVLVVCALTQWVFPLAYDAFLLGEGIVVLVAAARNAILVALLAWAVARLLRLPVSAPPPGAAGGGERAAATV